MKSTLLFIRILIFLLFLLSKAGAQTQTVVNGAPTTAVNFPSGSCVYNWTNNTPGIGLPASGTGNIPSFTAINTGGSPITATITAVPVSAVSTGFAYIANQFSNNVSVVNTTTNMVVATIRVGAHPTGVSASADGRRVYITNNGDNTVSVINTLTNTVSFTIPVGTSPYGICVSPDGSHIYVTNYNSSSVSVISTTNNAVMAIVTVGSHPYGIAISPDGTRVYCANSNDNTMSEINTATNTVIATVNVGPHPYGVVVGVDGTRVYVSSAYSNIITVVNTTNNTITATITASYFSDTPAMCLSPDGSRLYLVDTYIFIINTATNAIITNIPANTPYSISISLDGNFLYLTDENTSTLGVINLATNTSVTPIPVGSNPISFGNFISGGIDCTGSPITFSITVNPTPAFPPSITTGTIKGIISACVGSPSESPFIQNFTVSGSNLTTDVTAKAPPGFEVSLNPGSGYGSSITLSQFNGTLNGTIVYVRSAANAAVGNISGNVILTTQGTADQSIQVIGVVNSLPAMIGPSSQTVVDGSAIAAIHFTGTTTIFNWVNDTPGIGLAASGTGDIFSFRAINKGNSPIVATITVIPITLGTTGGLNPHTGCIGSPVMFTITVNPDGLLSITPTGTLSSLTTVYGKSSPSGSFIVKGTNLTSGILVTPPAGFEVSTDDINFSGTVTAGSAGSSISFPVYIRLAATTSVGNYSGNILLSSDAINATEVMPNSTVTKAILTIIVPNQTKVFGTPNPNFAIKYLGFVNGDQPTQLTTLPVIITIATQSSPVGQYTLTPSGATSANYIINNVSGTLIIEPPPNIISIPNTFTPNGDGINDVWTITGLVDYPQCNVAVYTRYGGLVYQSRGYPTPWDGTFQGSKLPDGTYYYIINPQTGTAPLAGYVTIIR